MELIKKYLFILVIITNTLVVFSQEYNEYRIKSDEFLKQKDYDKTIEYAKKDIESTKNEYGVLSENYANSLSNLASIYDKIDKLGEAAPYYRESIEIRKKVQGDKHPEYIASINNLVNLYKKQLKFLKENQNTARYRGYGENSSFYRKILNKLLYLEVGNLDCQSWQELDSLRRVYQMKQSYDTALVYAQKSLKKVEEEFSNKDINYAIILNNLAELYRQMGDYPKSISLCKEVIKIYKENLGEIHPDYINSINNLASLYEDNLNGFKGVFSDMNSSQISLWLLPAELYEKIGNYEKAIALYTEAINILKESDESNEKKYSYYSGLLDKVASLYYVLGNYEDAESLLLELINIKKEILGEKHPDFGESLYDLAELYMAMGNYQKAVPLYIDVMNICKEVLGEKHPEYLKSIDNLAYSYDHINNSKEAERLKIKALSISKEIYGNKHIVYAAYLDVLGWFYQGTGNYDKAGQLHIEALNIKKEVLGENHPDYVNYLHLLIHFYISTGNFYKAEPWLVEYINIQKEVLGENNPEYATSLYSLGRTYYEMSNFEKAEPLYIEALKIRREVLGVKHSDCAKILHDLAYLYMDMGEYNKAENSFKEALNINKAIYSERHPEYAANLNGLAKLHFEISNYLKAESLYIEALNIRREILGIEHPDYAISLNRLAQLYCETGNYQKAELLCFEALNIRKEVLGTGNIFYVRSLISAAGIFENMYNYDKAEQFYIEALNIFKEVIGVDHAEYVVTLNGLAIVTREIGNYEKAEQLFNEALRITKEVSGERSINYATTLNSLCILYFQKGNFEKAKPFVLEALNINKEVVGKKHYSNATYLNSLGSLYHKTGNYKKARQLYKKALNLNKEFYGDKHIDYFCPLSNLISLYYEIDNHEMAEPLIIEAIEILSFHIKQNFLFLSRNEKELFLNNIMLNFDIYNSFFMNYKSFNPSLTAMSFNNSLFHKGLLLETDRIMQQNILNSADTSIINTYREYLSIKQRLSKLYTLPLKDRNFDLGVLEEKANVLDKELVRKSSEFRTSQDKLTIKWNDIKQNLSADEAAIEFIHFSYYDEKWTDSIFYCALILRPEYEYPKMVYLFEENELEKIVRRQEFINDYSYVKYLYGWGDGKTASKFDTKYKGSSLYKTIWHPLDSLLNNVKTVYISPSGILHKISFAAISNSKSTLLSDKYQINYVSSTRNITIGEEPLNISAKESFVSIYGGIYFDVDSLKMVQNSRSYIEKDEDDILFASRATYFPNDTTRGNSWLYLNGTMEEAKKIKSEFDRNNITTQTFIEETATEESFKAFSDKTSPTIIHFATHGFFFPDVEKKHENEFNIGGQGKEVFKYSENPLFRSGLILAGANRVWTGKNSIPQVEDGILTAYEVSNTNLSNTKLVVMSACETGLGDIKGSEGVYGLQRAFKMAGVDKIIMTLWQIADHQTVEFMELFYNNLLTNGENIREAFYLSQLEMKKKYDPFYWAAFVLVE